MRRLALEREVAQLYPPLRRVRFTHRWGGRVAIHPDVWPRLHQPHVDLWVAIGCQGRGIALQTSMGAELARLVSDPSYESVLPLAPIRPIAFARFKQVGVATTISVPRLLDRLQLS